MTQAAVRLALEDTMRNEISRHRRIKPVSPPSAGSWRSQTRDRQQRAEEEGASVLTGTVPVWEDEKNQEHAQWR